MKLQDTIRLAFNTVRSNRLRTGITVSIIAFGIMALVGINTAIEAMKQKFTESFSAMGASGFTIKYQDMNMFRGGTQKTKVGARKKKRSNLNRAITKREAELFKESYKYSSLVSLNLRGTNSAIVSYGSQKTNPTVTVTGGDENYVNLNGYEVIAGRPLNDLDVHSGRNVCIIGYDIFKRFFSDPDFAIDKTIKINNIPYRVLGVLESKGSTFGRSMDNIVVTSYNSVLRFFNSENASFTVGVKVSDILLVDQALGEAEGVFRQIRKNGVTEANNFAIDKSDKLVQQVMGNLNFITWSAVIIGIITLAGAAVGLTNIMLVSVAERTKEVGLVKAIGGKQRDVRRQFLYEAITISLMGAVVGVFLGVLLGNLFSMVLSTSFVLPVNWIIFGIIICSVVGLLAGIYPSLKAGRLNPIEALRYE